MSSTPVLKPHIPYVCWPVAVADKEAQHCNVTSKLDDAQHNFASATRTEVGGTGVHCGGAEEGDWGIQLPREGLRSSRLSFRILGVLCSLRPCPNAYGYFCKHSFYMIFFPKAHRITQQHPLIKIDVIIFHSGFPIHWYKNRYGLLCGKQMSPLRNFS